MKIVKRTLKAISDDKRRLKTKTTCGTNQQVVKRFIVKVELHGFVKALFVHERTASPLVSQVCTGSQLKTFSILET